MRLDGGFRVAPIHQHRTYWFGQQVKIIYKGATMVSRKKGAKPTKEGSEEGDACAKRIAVLDKLIRLLLRNKAAKRTIGFRTNCK